MRPVGDPRHQIMFYRIKVNIVDVPFEIGIVSNCVFPESTLPKLIFAAQVARYKRAGIQNRAGEQALHAPPSSGIVEVRGRQRHDYMQMFRKNHDFIDLKRSFGLRYPEGLPQQANVFDENR